MHADFNPYSRKLLADPYPAYAALQEESPVAHNERFGFWCLSRFDDVQAALKDWQTYSSAQGITLVEFAGLKPMIILMDPPRQTELRALLTRAFTPRRVAALEGRMREIATELIDVFRGRGACEFVREFSAPYPTTVIADMLGVDAADRERFKEWSDAIMTSGSADAESLKQAYGEIFGYFERTVAERRRRPGDDLVSALVSAEIDGKRLGDDELLGFCALLLIAGNETMANFLANALLALERRADLRRRLAADPSLLPNAIEELLRFAPPVHELARTLTRDVELHGRRLAKGERVLLLIAAANRDPRRFWNPDQVEIGRDPNPHLSLGFGIHFCMGASLARLEARVALAALLEALPEYAVATEAITWLRTANVRGPAELPLRFPAPA